MKVVKSRSFAFPASLALREDGAPQDDLKTVRAAAANRDGPEFLFYRN